MAELLTGVDFSLILADIKALVPIILPVTIGFIGFRKGLQFLKSQLKGA